MARSELFEKFLTGVNTPIGMNPDAMDAIPHIGALRLLAGDERREAEDILIGMLAENDGRAADALADVGCVRAIPALREATTVAASPRMRVFAAAALLKLGDDSGRAAVVHLLRTHEGDVVDRGNAAELLTEFPDPDDELLLEVASTDPDPSIRALAARAALTVWHLDTEEAMGGEVLLGIRGRLRSSLTSVRAEALTELRVIQARRAAGETAAAIGLTWHADKERKPLRRFFDSLDRDTLDYPTEGLLKLTGRERALVEDVIVQRLDEDRRAVRAAGRLGVHRAIEPLRELHRSAKGHAREEIAAVLATLTR